MTVVSAVASLLPWAGSTAADVTDAVFVIKPPVEGAVTVIVIVGAGPTARLARVQVTVPPAAAQVHPAPEALANEVVGGRTSVTTTLGAVAGPALATSRL
jgi:hypothetical protein